MRRLRLYLDTTIWNFPFSSQAPDLRKITLQFFDKVRLGLFDVFVSEAVVAEFNAAREPRYSEITGLLKEINPPFLDSSAEIDRLAALYLEKRALPQGSKADAFHVAHATVHEMDYLLSWNYKHLANPNRRAKVAAINVEEGYRYPITIATPTEVMYVE